MNHKQTQIQIHFDADMSVLLSSFKFLLGNIVYLFRFLRFKGNSSFVGYLKVNRTCAK